MFIKVQVRGLQISFIWIQIPVTKKDPTDKNKEHFLSGMLDPDSDSVNKLIYKRGKKIKDKIKESLNLSNEIAADI